jgi:hypothetical protein
MPRQKGEYICNKCQTKFAFRQGLHDHTKNIICTEKEPVKQEGMQSTIDKLVATILEGKEKICKLEETVSKLQTVIDRVSNIIPNVNIELNVFTNRPSAYPNFRQVPEMMDVLRMVFKRDDLNPLMEYIFFNDSYPRNRVLKPMLDGSINVYRGSANDFNGWELRSSEVVFDEVVSVFDNIMYTYVMATEETTNENMRMFYKNIVLPLGWEWDLSDTGFNVTSFRRSKGCVWRKDNIYDRLRAFMQTVV